MALNLSCLDLTPMLFIRRPNSRSCPPYFRSSLNPLALMMSFLQPLAFPPFQVLRAVVRRFSVLARSMERVSFRFFQKLGSRPWFNSQSLLKQVWERSEEHTSELQSRENLVCRLL